MSVGVIIALACFAIVVLFCVLLLIDTSKGRKRRGRGSAGLDGFGFDWDSDCGGDSCGSCGGRGQFGAHTCVHIRPIHLSFTCVKRQTEKIADNLQLYLMWKR